MTKPSIASNQWRRFLTALLPLIGTVAGVFGVIHFRTVKGAETYSWAALVFASVVMIIILLILDFVGASGSQRSIYGWLRLLLGADGRLSTSRTQVLMWTIGIAAAALYLGGIAIFQPQHDASVFSDTNWNDYLILLGGPFAAAVLAQYTVSSKLVSGTLQKSPTTAAAPSAMAAATAPLAGTPTLSNVVTNDDGDPDVVDTQYFIFNLVVFVYVFGDFVSRIIDKGVTDFATKYSLPTVPAVLLGLTSASALTYVGNKAALQNGPRITTLNPVPPIAGRNVDILGVNLVSPGADSATLLQSTLVSVVDTQDPTQTSVLAPTNASPTKVTFAMPANYGGRTVNIQVVTSGGAATGAYQALVSAVPAASG
ncbi:MAG TPA: hypothetical protein VF311_03320 [Terriglobales bacterium]